MTLTVKIPTLDLPYNPEQARDSNESDVRVTWRQCNTRDTVGAIMGKPRGCAP